MNISGVFQELSCVNTDNDYADYESFSFDTDWQPFSGTTACYDGMISPDGMLYDSLELYNRSIQSQFYNIEMETIIESLTDTGRVDKCSFMNENLNSNSYQNFEEIPSTSLLPEKQFQFALEASQGSNMVDIFSCPFQTLANNNSPVTVSTKEDTLTKPQNQVSTGIAEIENSRDTNPNIDPHQQTPNTLCMVSVPTYEITFSIQDDSKDVAKGLRERKNSPKKGNGQKKPSRYPPECMEHVRERNKEAARAYRKRKRIQNQELEKELDLLTKKYAMLEEEYTSVAISNEEDRANIKETNERKISPKKRIGEKQPSSCFSRERNKKAARPYRKRKSIQNQDLEKELFPSYSQEYMKPVRERRKEAARAYRLRKKIENQKHEAELKLLQKNYALLDEELRSLALPYDSEKSS